MPNKKNYKKVVKNKPSLGTIIKTLLLLLVLLSLPAAYFLTTQNQDVRQQAASCSEEDVNTEFRPYVQGTDKPWKSGNKMNVTIGDKIDVNCFAKTGSALLSNGKITLKVDGVTKQIPASSVINDGRSLRAYTITQGGVHKFTCANTNGCSDTDTLTVPKPSPSPSIVPTPSPADDDIACTMDAKQCPDGSFVGRVAPSCEFAPCPSSTDSCPNPSIADVNKDCKVDLKDYDLFLSEFIKRQ